MKFEDRKEFVRLLNLYQEELLSADGENKRLIQGKKAGKEEAEHGFTSGVKAQYKYARRIAQRMAVLLESELDTEWSYRCPA